MKKLISFLIVLHLNVVFGLEVENKLIFRIISISSSKKTILINKGQEDGLKIGDQAKFINKDGTSYALATVRKTSPGRSLWSIFRINSTTELYKNNVTQLKIIEPVKLTEDSSKLILGEKPVGMSSEKIPLAPTQQKNGIVSYRDVTNIKKYRNYSSLEDHFSKKRDPSVSWERIDQDYFPYSDKVKIKKILVKESFKSLETKPQSAKVLLSLRKEFSSILDEPPYKISKKEIEKTYSSLEDFDYR